MPEFIPNNNATPQYPLYTGGGLSIEGTSDPLAGWIGNAESLTPEALLLYCQHQLKSIDNDIKNFMNAQKYNLERKKMLQELKSELQANVTIDKDKDLADRQYNINAAYKKAYAEAVALGDTDAAQTIKADFDSWFPKDSITAPGSNIDEGKCPTETESGWNAKIAHVDDMIDDISKNMELNMIQLQSMMSQRQTAIQLTQSIMDKMQKTLEQLAAKVGG